MCRLFGFRSVIPSQVHRSLLAAENAIGMQSEDHPDGWGVAYYVDGSPHVTKSPTLALGDQLFHRLSGVVSSETVLAHVRKATVGHKTVLNTHPFQYGRWVFAHNGNVPGFDTHREQLVMLIEPRLRRFVLGETDSETIFHILLSELSKGAPLDQPRPLADVMLALRRTVDLVTHVVGTCDVSDPLLLTLMVTDGRVLAACQGGKDLYWSTHKNRCSDRDACSSLSPECEAPTTTGRVNHCIISSEPLSGENVWQRLNHGDMVGVDEKMLISRAALGARHLPIVLERGAI